VWGSTAEQASALGLIQAGLRRRRSRSWRSWGGRPPVQMPEAGACSRLFKELQLEGAEAPSPLLHASSSSTSTWSVGAGLAKPTVSRSRARRRAGRLPAEAIPAGRLPTTHARASLEMAASTARSLGFAWLLEGPARRPSTARSPKPAAAAIEARRTTTKTRNLLGVQEGQEEFIRAAEPG